MVEVFDNQNLDVKAEKRNIQCESRESFTSNAVASTSHEAAAPVSDAAGSSTDDSDIGELCLSSSLDTLYSSLEHLLSDNSGEREDRAPDDGTTKSQCNKSHGSSEAKKVTGSKGINDETGETGWERRGRFLVWPAS